MASVALGPEVYEADRLDALRLNLVEVANPVGLDPEVAVELCEPAPPRAHVGLELPLLFLVEAERELFDPVAFDLGQLLAHPLSLSLQGLAEITRLPFSPLAQPPDRQRR